MASFEILTRLFQVIEKRKHISPSTSYTAKLFKKGRNKIAQKLGEESVELIIEAIENKKKEAIEESADMLYHLLVLWADMGITPEEVCTVLAKREGVSGIEEKKQRKKKSQE